MYNIDIRIFETKRNKNKMCLVDLKIKHDRTNQYELRKLCRNVYIKRNSRRKYYMGNPLLRTFFIYYCRVRGLLNAVLEVYAIHRQNDDVR